MEQLVNRHLPLATARSLLRSWTMDLRYLNCKLHCTTCGHRWTRWCELRPVSLIARCCERCGKVEFDPRRDQIEPWASGRRSQTRYGRSAPSF